MTRPDWEALVGLGLVLAVFAAVLWALVELVVWIAAWWTA